MGKFDVVRTDGLVSSYRSADGYAGPPLITVPLKQTAQNTVMIGDTYSNRGAYRVGRN